MLDTGAPLLKNFWYLVMPGNQLRAGATQALTVMGEPLLLGRDRDGRAFALLDICPHRGIPLHYGSFDGREVTCCYHGWKFAPDGRCTEIPSLLPDQDFDISRIKARSFPLREVQGNIWVYFTDRRDDDGGARPPPEIVGVGDGPPLTSISQTFPCDIDQAAFGLMDPTHAAFVHTSWWWKKDARRLRQKEKHFEPAPLGWRMTRHRLPSEHRAYKLLGSNVTTEITYSLPGVRIEQIQGERHAAASLTAITPVDGETTVVHQSLYCTLGWAGLIKPLATRLAHVFLGQDRDVVVKQQEGLKHQPTLMLIDDADTQAKWFYRVKKEWQRAAAEGRAFENPVKARTLRWRS